MTYSLRGALLEDFVAHYASCPELESFVVVWNGSDLDSYVSVERIRAASPHVPVRFRVEKTPSMNNRYKQDPLIQTEALLILDDDIRVDCASIKRALLAFHRSRRRDIVGWFPRFSSRQSDNEFSYTGEPGTIARGEYNLVLSGAAFVNHDYFKLYWSPPVTPLRALVDELWNCDDLLFNFVVAGAGGGTLYLRPKTLYDVSHETGVGISHDEAAFIRKAERCLAEFHAHFPETALKSTRFDFSDDPPPDCDEGRSLLFCRY